jgi:hypothetical protein
MASWSHEHLQERFDTVFGLSEFTNSLHQTSDFLRKLTDDEREELR